MAVCNRILITLVFIFVACLAAQAQIDASSPSGRPDNEPLPQGLMESMAKQRIENEKKEYDELLKKSGEAVDLTKEIHDSYVKNHKLTSQDRAKLKSLEKLLKKVRSDLGGEGTDEETKFEESKSLASVLNTLLKNTEDLFDEVKQTSRHTISAVAINSSNVILSIVKFLRFGK